MNTDYTNIQCTLQPPANREITETPISFVWFGEDGIMYSISKNKPRVIEDIRKTFRILRELTGNKKVPLIADTSQTKTYTPEMRKELAREMLSLFSAVALVPCTPLGKMMSAILFLKDKKYPSEMFDTVEEAQKWIRKYTRKT